MLNTIVKDTYDLWFENIDYLIRTGTSEGKASEEIAESILEYLEGEGAFELELGKTLAEKRFEKGMRIHYRNAFIKEDAVFTVKDREEDTVILTVTRKGEDGSESVLDEEFKIQFDSRKRSEYVIIYEGHSWKDTMLYPETDEYMAFYSPAGDILCTYSIKGTFNGELDATRELVASENALKPEEVTVKREGTVLEGDATDE